MFSFNLSWILCEKENGSWVRKNNLNLRMQIIPWTPGAWTPSRFGSSIFLGCQVPSTLISLLCPRRRSQGSHSLLENVFHCLAKKHNYTEVFWKFYKSRHTNSLEKKCPSKDSNSSGGIWPGSRGPHLIVKGQQSIPWGTPMCETIWPCCSAGTQQPSSQLIKAVTGSTMSRCLLPCSQDAHLLNERSRSGVCQSPSNSDNLQLFQNHTAQLPGRSVDT